MKQLFSFITVTAFAAIVLFSCKKDYQKASTEFILRKRQLSLFVIYQILVNF